MENRVILSVRQNSVVSNIVRESNDCCLFGTGGTGKTFCIEEIYNRYKEQGIKVHLWASTNEAASILKGINGKAITIHRGLNLDVYGNVKEKNNFTLNLPKSKDVVIIDECSMINQRLYDKIKSLLSSKIIFVGDPNQLVVKPMFSYSNMRIFVLNKNFRSSKLDITELTKSLDRNVTFSEIFRLKQSENVIYYKDHTEFIRAIGQQSVVLSYKNSIVDKYKDLGLNSITLHKSQGKSYNDVFIDLRDIISSYTNTDPNRNTLDKKTATRLVSVGVSRARNKVHLFIGDRRKWKTQKNI